jgi:trans-aconitate methyltransferase
LCTCRDGAATARQPPLSQAQVGAQVGGGDAVTDVGCGAGHITAYLHELGRNPPNVLIARTSSEHRTVARFTPLLADAARFARHSPGDRWHVDET